VTRLSVWPPLSPNVYFRRPRQLPFPLREPTCRVFALGRHALWHGVRMLGLESGDEVLAPAYHHGSEIEALIQAGVTCRFYAGTDDLEPAEEELEALVGPRTRALLLIHYLGFPQQAAHWRHWCDERGLFLLEDAAQAWMAESENTPVGSSGDIAIFCLYKTLGVPDGAALVSGAAAAGSPVPGDSPRSGRFGAASLARRHAAWARARARLPRRRARRAAQASFRPGDDFELGDPSAGPLGSTLFLLPRLASAGAPTRRRRNYQLLLERLPGQVASPFSTLTAGASPFVFPLDTSRKAALLQRLRESGVHAFDFWSVGHASAQPSHFPGVQRRRERTIGLPVHQELRKRDVERIAAIAAAALEQERA
jgi:dTDP-4-amino-4,6-dideoxygalactose transaminase